MRIICAFFLAVSITSLAQTQDNTEPKKQQDYTPSPEDISPGEDRANVPVTAHGNTWYLHVPSDHKGSVELRFVAEPASVTLLRTGEPLPSSHKDGVLAIDMADVKKESTNDVLVVTWPESGWEKDIRAFEEQDKKLGDKHPDVVFLGSSSIRVWDLAKYMPGLPALNRGFGGSQYEAAALYADRILLPHRPKVVVLYSGDNDIASGKSPEWVFADFRHLIRRIEHMLPDTHIFVLSIKPSVARWALWDKMKQTNELFSAFAEKDAHVDYIDVATSLLGPDGTPRADLLRTDGLHLNDKGYEIWSAIVRPLIDASLK